MEEKTDTLPQHQEVKTSGELGEMVIEIEDHGGGGESERIRTRGFQYDNPQQRITKFTYGESKRTTQQTSRCE